MMKRFILLLAAAMVLPQSLFAYDFSAPATTGQTLYFNIIGQNAVEVTSQNNTLPTYSSLNGALIIPDNVEYNSTTYSVTRIGDYAFRDCLYLTSVTIPISVTSIGDRAINWCEGITSLFVENGNTVFDSREDCNAIIETATNTLIVGCVNTVIPNSIIRIADNAFGNNIYSVIIPTFVTSIGNYAFKGCSSIECLSEVPPEVDYYTFSALSNNTIIYVPCGCVAAYQAAYGWGSFTNIQEVAGCSSEGVSVYTEGNDIVVGGSDGHVVTLYDDYGNVRDTGTTPVRFTGLTSGTYHVKVGILPARMKVVVQ